MFDTLAQEIEEKNGVQTITNNENNYVLSCWSKEDEFFLLFIA